MQRYTMVFITINAVYDEHANQFQLTHASGKKQEKLDKYPMLCIQFWAPDNGRRNRLKRVEHL